MVHNTNPKSNKHSYIIPKVRNRKLSDLKILNDHILNKKDKKTTDNIYKEHLKNNNRLEKAKKSLKNKKKKLVADSAEVLWYQEPTVNRLNG